MAQELGTAALAPAALAAVKDWLRISLSDDDANLTGHLRAALALCEAFTGAVLLQRDFAEILPVTGGWQCLSRHPVQAISSVTGLPADGPEFALAVDAYAMDIDGDGAGRVRIYRPGSAGRVRVTYTAGMAAHWAGLPEALRQGVVRLAAHLHGIDGVTDDAAIPAAVAALWRPYRRMRMA